MTREGKVNLEQHYLEYQEKGYTVIPDVFDAAYMETVKNKFLQLKADGVGGPAGWDWWFDNMLERAPKLMLPAISHPDILELAELIMGPFVQLDNLTLSGFPSVSAEKANGTVSGWHRDRYANIPKTDVYLRPLSMNAISYFQDLTDEYGPLRVIPGSHRKPITIDPSMAKKPHPDEVLIRMKAGDVVLTHNGLLHSGTPNTSGGTRYFFSIYYNLTWLKHTDTFGGPNLKRLIAQARLRNDHRLLRLYGIDDHLAARCNSGFIVDDELRWNEWIENDKKLVNPEVDVYWN